jgi:signal transduction histidine kinase
MAMRTAAVRAVAERRPTVVDAVLAAVLAALSAPLAVVGGVTGPAWLWFAALFVPLVWRRRAPLAVFWTVWVLWSISLTGESVGRFLWVVPVVTLYTIARHRSRWYLWPSAVALAAPFSLSWLVGGGEWYDLVALGGIGAAAVLFGVNGQTRQAYLAGLEDRARRLERDRDQQAQLAVAAERVRIAREMHDIVAHNLAVMVALADGAAATTFTTPQRAVDMMEKASQTGRSALGEARRLVGLLREGEPHDQPAGDRATSPQPGLGDIDELVGQVRAAGLSVAVTEQGAPGAWAPGAGLAVYRIIQEALTNVMKHVGPSSVAEVRLRYSPTDVDVEILDDGGDRRSGAESGNGRPGTGHGLVGMKERVASYGGLFEAGPRSGAGWRVHVRFSVGEVT